MKQGISLLISVLFLAPSLGLTQCLESESIVALDAKWELALNNGSREILEEIAHPNFVWVHNHAGDIQESKSAFLEYYDERFGGIRNLPQGISLGIRDQRNVKVIQAENSTVIYGFVDITRPGPGSVESRPIITFHFMRTYVESNGDCLLLANHTMEVPKE